jgi:hypothetical protein
MSSASDKASRVWTVDNVLKLVHTLASVASITGISLLWLSSKTTVTADTLLVNIPIVGACIVFSIACIAAAGLLLHAAAKELFTRFLYKSLFFGLAGPVVTIIMLFWLNFIWTMAQLLIEDGIVL